MDYDDLLGKASMGTWRPLVNFAAKKFIANPDENEGMTILFLLETDVLLIEMDGPDFYQAQKSEPLSNGETSCHQPF